MNGWEAIKSGKRLRHPDLPEGWHELSLLQFREDGVGPPEYLGANLLDDDRWTIQEPEVTITRGDFFDAIRAVITDYMTKRQIVVMTPTGMSRKISEQILEDTYGDVARELGLSEKP